jgi:hypothetical protein
MNVVSSLASGVKDARKVIKDPRVLDRFLDRTIRSRIGIRLLIEQQLALHMARSVDVGYWARLTSLYMAVCGLVKMATHRSSFVTLITPFVTPFLLRLMQRRIVGTLALSGCPRLQVFAAQFTCSLSRQNLVTFTRHLLVSTFTFSLALSNATISSALSHITFSSALSHVTFSSPISNATISISSALLHIAASPMSRHTSFAPHHPRLCAVAPCANTVAVADQLEYGSMGA